MTTAFSPNGATENSQGCQPLGQGPNHSQSPERAPETPSPRWGYSYGLGSLSRGYHPWLFSVAPLGLAKASILAAAVVCFLLGRFPILAQSVSRAEQELNFAKAEVQKLRLAKEADKQNRMYEDIEIMRQLFSQQVFDQHQSLVMANTCAKCHASTHSGVEDQRLKSLFFGINLTESQGLQRWHHGVTPVWHFPVSLQGANSPLAPPEGAYLKDHGVIFTMTFPPPSQDPRPKEEKPPAPQISDWELTKKKLRGEKTEPPPASSDGGSPRIGDVILKLLAENGKNFSQLLENESITVVVTFREPAGTAKVEGPMTEAAVAALRNAGNDPHADLRGYYEGASSLVLKSTSKVAAEPGGNTSNPKSARDYKLLGDLHLKQGNYEQATLAYKHAWNIVEEKDVKDGLRYSLLRNMAQAAIQTENYEGARQILSNLASEKASLLPSAKQPMGVTQNSKKQPSQADTGPVLASKLTITAPRRLLDQVGGGKISFAEFKKSATVEYLTFGEAEKKPAGDKPAKANP